MLTSGPGEIPCFKIYESEKTLAFLDINPISKGHAVRLHSHHILISSQTND